MQFDRLLLSVGEEKHTDLISLCKSFPQVNGIVLGDPFCENVEVDKIILACEKAKEEELFVAYQTPVYVTSRNLTYLSSLIRYMSNKGLINEVFIQEVGMLEEVSGISKVSIVWSIYGWQREFPDMDIPINQRILNFLISHGVDYFEITTAVAYSIYKHHYPLKFKKYLYHHRLDPISFSRINYAKSFGLNDENLWYLKDEDGRGLEYGVWKHRIFEFPDEKEFITLINSNEKFKGIILEDFSLKQLEKTLEKLLPLG